MKNNFIKTLCLIFCLLMMVACGEKPITTPETSYTTGQSNNIESFTSIQLIEKEEINKLKASVHFVDKTSQNNEWNVVFKSKIEVSDFKFLAIDEADSIMVESILFEVDTLAPNESFVASTYLNDVTANRGISFMDTNGNTRYFAIRLSMKDGSVTLSEFSVNHKTPVEEMKSLFPIEEDKITTNKTLKTFKDLGLTFQFPAQWDALQQQGEDGTVYYFREPDLGEKCQFLVSLTGAEYKNDRTQNEYLEYLSSSYENVEISFYENQAISGYEGKKVIATYVEDNQKFIRIAYDNVVAGIRMYDFTITYPESQKETYDDIFNSILQSIVIE